MNEEHRAIFNSINLEDQVFDMHWQMSTPRPPLFQHSHNTRHHKLWNEVKSFDNSPHYYTRCNVQLLLCSVQPLLVTWQVAWSVYVSSAGFFARLCFCIFYSNSIYFISQKCLLNHKLMNLPLPACYSLVLSKCRPEKFTYISRNRKNIITSHSLCSHSVLFTRNQGSSKQQNCIFHLTRDCPIN